MTKSKREIRLRRAGKIVMAISSGIAYLGMILFMGLLLWLLIIGMAPAWVFCAVVLSLLSGGIGWIVGDYMVFESYQVKNDRSLME